MTPLWCLDGKVAVVTGGGRGLGRAAALLLAASGAGVVVADYGGALDARERGTSEAADQVAAEIEAAGGRAVACAEDVATVDGGRRIVEAALDTFGRLDAMVCFAGIMVQKYLWEMDERDWDDVIAVHLKGHFSCAQAAARVMMPQRSGRLVFVGSGSWAGIANQPSYSAAKAGILGFAWSCASGLGTYGITTNCVLPNAATRMSDKTFSDYVALTDEPSDVVRSERAAGTFRDPAIVAPLVLYLVSDAAAAVNGQVFLQNGYRIARMDPISFGSSMESDGPWDRDALFARFAEELGPDLSRQSLPWPPPDTVARPDAS
jgi:NAD(P)-dependent dehydrogenase (short-subunit alcohol dehydrogenase family)